MHVLYAPSYNRRHTPISDQKEEQTEAHKYQHKTMKIMKENKGNLLDMDLADDFLNLTLKQKYQRQK